MSTSDPQTTLTEEDFAALGRALFTHAHESVFVRATDEHFSGGKALEFGGLKVSVRYSQAKTQDMQPQVCCICVLDGNGVVICRGSCCADW